MPAGDADVEARRQDPGSCPETALELGVVFPQDVLGKTFDGGEGPHTNRLFQVDLLKLEGLQKRQRTKVGAVVLGNLDGSQKLRVEVLAGIAKGPGPVLVDDGGEVGPVTAFGSSHSGLAVVVGGHGQGPVAQFPVGVFQIAGGGVGSGDGVQAFINGAAHPELVGPAGPGHELPDSGGALAGAGSIVEGGFHMRQAHQHFGKAVALKDGLHLLQVAT